MTLIPTPFCALICKNGVVVDTVYRFFKSEEQYAKEVQGAINAQFVATTPD